MTKKDYELIAHAIENTGRIYFEPAEQETLFAVANVMAGELKRDNPRFDRSKFLAACALES